MKNRITTTITTMMLMLFSYGINVGGLSGGLSFCRQTSSNIPHCLHYSR